MDITSMSTPGLLVVSLSRQNLEGLLQQLDEGAAEAQIARVTPQGRLIVLAQEDEKHYGSRAAGESA